MKYSTIILLKCVGFLLILISQHWVIIVESLLWKFPKFSQPAQNKTNIVFLLLQVNLIRKKSNTFCLQPRPFVHFKQEQDQMQMNLKCPCLWPI